ncbi:MAG TPA: hypothetical protein VFM53_11740 [Anaeromyxobacteraceae bacterium]|nr:hypothetical protein [Anaeromyxobacteraceae bacterium]
MDGKAARRLLGGVLVGCVGLGLGYALGKLGMTLPSPGQRLTAGEKLLRIALAGLGIWLAFLVHEAGHLAGGLSQGFRFIFLAAGPLWVEPGPRGVALRFNRTLQTWGGVAAAMPRDGRNLRQRFAVMVAAGPAASLLLALLGWGAWTALPAGAPRFLAGVTALGSAALFLATVQPFGAGGGFASDGGRLLRLWRRGPVGEREVAILALTAASAGGARPRDWPGAVVEAALRPEDGSAMELAARVYAAQRASDSGDPETARRQLDAAGEIAKGMSPILRSVVAAEAAWLRASQGDVEGARPLVAAADGPFVERHALFRARSALRLAEGDREGARRDAEEGLSALARTRFGKASERDRELLEELRTRASA